MPFSSYLSFPIR